MPRKLTTSRTIAVVASSLGLFSACGIGMLFDRPSPPPPPPTVNSGLVVHPSSLHFSRTSIHPASPATQQLQIANPTSTIIVFASIHTGNKAFQIAASTCGNTLWPHATCIVTVSFQPNTAHEIDSLLTLQLAGFAPLNIPLVGEGLRAPASTH